LMFLYLATKTTQSSRMFHWDYVSISNMQERLASVTNQSNLLGKISSNVM
jgi:hypothetical protein